MAVPATGARTRNPVLITIGIVFVLALAAGLVYLHRPAPAPADLSGPATPEAKAYLPNLALSNVKIQATENFMQQRVVEVLGDIANNGPRPLQSVEVYCLFYGVDGREVYRERQAIVTSKAGPLQPGQTRAFRLPFDALPESWNQAIPKLVIASIHFAK
ncbi:MAG: hypothetical protein JO270_04495 [Acidobacteriaceae bacterium]|nr:hypothetical protein [Acidobacteriaceae bacterium]